MTKSAERKKDRRSETQSAPISAELKQEAITQLEHEIRLIEGWLTDLEGTREDNSASILARKSYKDMLQSRKDLLNTLKKH